MGSANWFLVGKTDVLIQLDWQVADKEVAKDCRQRKRQLHAVNVTGKDPKPQATPTPFYSSVGNNIFIYRLDSEGYHRYH